MSRTVTELYKVLEPFYQQNTAMLYDAMEDLKPALDRFSTTAHQSIAKADDEFRQFLANREPLAGDLYRLVRIAYDSVIEQSADLLTGRSGTDGTGHTEESLDQWELLARDADEGTSSDRLNPYVRDDREVYVRRTLILDVCADVESQENRRRSDLKEAMGMSILQPAQKPDGDDISCGRPPSVTHTSSRSPPLRPGEWETVRLNFPEASLSKRAPKDTHFDACPISSISPREP